MNGDLYILKQADMIIEKCIKKKKKEKQSPKIRLIISALLCLAFLVSLVICIVNLTLWYYF